MGPDQGPRLVPGAGRQLSLPKNQGVTQGALPCIPSAVLVSKLFGRTSRSMVKKNCVYAKETHIPRLASGYMHSHSKKPEEFFSCSYNVSNIESRVSGKNRTPLPCTKGRIVQIQHLSADSSPCVCHSQGAPCRASQVPGYVGVCLSPPAQPRALQAGLCPERLHHCRGFTGTREQLIW